MRLPISYPIITAKCYRSKTRKVLKITQNEASQFRTGIVQSNHAGQQDSHTQRTQRRDPI